jgi:acyl-CoA reductase-like NAD-dependent aldehyde dehydrogenase
MALVVKEPYGVVVGIAPWNAALLLGLRAVVAPIACGNTVVYSPQNSSANILPVSKHPNLALALTISLAEYSVTLASPQVS